MVDRPPEATAYRRESSRSEWRESRSATLTQREALSRIRLYEELCLGKLAPRGGSLSQQVTQSRKASGKQTPMNELQELDGRVMA